MINTRDIKNKINRDNIHISIHGDLISDLGDLFTIFFKGTVADEIEKTLGDILTNTVP